MLDLDSLASFELNVLIEDISEWGVKRLMASALTVIYVFTNHLPVVKIKYSLAKYGVGVKQSVQNEPIKMSVRKF